MEQTWTRWVSFIICSLSLFYVHELFFIILNSLFTDSLHFPSVFTHEFTQLFFNAMNWIKIIKCDLGYSLCFIYFDVIIHQWPKKKFKLVDVWSCATTDTGDAGRATFSRLIENH